MKVNGIDTETIKAQASSILQSKQKVDLEHEELELLWENAKLTNDASLFENVSDEDALAMFDMLDNKGNTAASSYKLLLNWLKNMQTNVSDTLTEQKPVVNPTPAPVAPAETKPAEETTPTVVAAPPADTAPAEEITPPAETAPAEETAPPADTAPAEEITPSAGTKPTEETKPATSTSKAAVVKQSLSLRPNATRTLTINDTTYVFTNLGAKNNNLKYYVLDGKLVVEGSNVRITSAAEDEDHVDNIHVIGDNNEIDMGEGDDIISVEGTLNMIYGGSGNDLVKMKGTMNTADLGSGDDTVWMSGTNNVAMGQGGEDNFFAHGADNTLFGHAGTDASFYLETDGIGHQFRVENTISPEDAKDFIDWVNGEEGGPPYTKLPPTLEGHKVDAYDDDTYTDKYEESPMIYTEYRDIAYRAMNAKTSVNKITGEASVEKYDAEGNLATTISFAVNGDVTVQNGDIISIMKADEVQYIDADGRIVKNPGSQDQILENLATGKYSIMVTNISVLKPNIVTGEQVNTASFPPLEEPFEIDGQMHYPVGGGCVTQRNTLSMMFDGGLYDSDGNSVVAPGPIGKLMNEILDFYTESTEKHYSNDQVQYDSNMAYISGIRNTVIDTALPLIEKASENPTPEINKLIEDLFKACEEYFMGEKDPETVATNKKATEDAIKALQSAL